MSSVVPLLAFCGLVPFFLESARPGSGRLCSGCCHIWITTVHFMLEANQLETSTSAQLLTGTKYGTLLFYQPALVASLISWCDSKCWFLIFKALNGSWLEYLKIPPPYETTSQDLFPNWQSFPPCCTTINLVSSIWEGLLCNDTYIIKPLAPPCKVGSITSSFPTATENISIPFSLRGLGLRQIVLSSTILIPRVAIYYLMCVFLNYWVYFYYVLLYIICSEHLSGENQSRNIFK